MSELTSLDQSSLYQVLIFTDHKAGEIHIHEPVSLNESQELLPTLFFGKTVMGTPNGPLSIQFPIQASSFQDALDSWLPSLKAKLKEIESSMVRQTL